MRILSLDQSTKITGYAIFDDNKYICSGKITSDDKNPIERINIMVSGIDGLIQKYNPDLVLFEDVQFQKNYRSFQLLSQLQGAIIYLLCVKNIAFQIISVNTWRKRLGFTARKRVEQKQEAINYIMDNFGIKCDDDEAEAICIGIGGGYLNERQEKRS